MLADQTELFNGYATPVPYNTVVLYAEPAIAQRRPLRAGGADAHSREKTSGRQGDGE